MERPDILIAGGRFGSVVAGRVVEELLEPPLIA